jgi:hypothetical protein
MTTRTTVRQRTAIDLKLSEPERAIFEAMPLAVQQAYVEWWLSAAKPPRSAHRDCLAAFLAGYQAAG